LERGGGGRREGGRREGEGGKEGEKLLPPICLPCFSITARMEFFSNSKMI
jgi:hypothetical protein